MQVTQTPSSIETSEGKACSCQKLMRTWMQCCNISKGCGWWNAHVCVHAAQRKYPWRELYDLPWAIDATAYKHTPSCKLQLWRDYRLGKRSETAKQSSRCARHWHTALLEHWKYTSKTVAVCMRECNALSVDRMHVGGSMNYECVLWGWNWREYYPTSLFHTVSIVLTVLCIELGCVILYAVEHMCLRCYDFTPVRKVMCMHTRLACSDACTMLQACTSVMEIKYDAHTAHHSDSKTL